MENAEQSPPSQTTATERATRSAMFYSGLHRWRSNLRRLWWIPLITLSLGVSVQWYLVTNAPKLFISVGQMIVSIQINVSEKMFSEEMSQFLGTQVALMQSGAVFGRAQEFVRTNRPDLAPAPVKVEVAIIPKTTIFILKASGSEPKYTQAYLQGCMEGYKDLKKSMRNDTSESTLLDITKTLGGLEKELRKCTDAIDAFEATNNVALWTDQINGAATYLSALNRTLADLQREYKLLNLLTFEQDIQRQQKNSATDPGTSASSVPDLMQSDANYSNAKKDIQMLKAEQQELGEFLRPKHPKMEKLSVEIAKRERLLNIYREQSQEQRANYRNALALQITNLVQTVEEWEGKSLENNRKIGELQKLKSNKQATQSLYDRLLATMKTLELNKGINPESVNINEHASPARVDRADLPKSLALAGLAGLAVGVGILLLLNRLDDRLNSYTELKGEFDEEVLGQIPRDRQARRGGDAQLIRREDDRHAFMEAYRNLRSSLLYIATTGTRPKTILVTSSIPNDGKSMTTANLAITMALSGSRVLLVDADLRKGVQHQRFQLPSTPGLTESLAENKPWQAHVKPTNVENLSLLPRGATTQHSSELFLNPVTPVFLRESAAEYDFVIVDSPPVMAADDVTSLAPKVDGVIFVIRAQKTSARVAHAALDLLYQRRVKVLGLVFNAVEANVSEYYYYKYRDYYASYPSK